MKKYNIVRNKGGGKAVQQVLDQLSEEQIRSIVRLADYLKDVSMPK